MNRKRKSDAAKAYHSSRESCRVRFSRTVPAFSTPSENVYFLRIQYSERLLGNKDRWSEIFFIILQKGYI